MKKIDDFSLEKHECPYETWPRRTRLYCRGRDTGVKIPGYIIEAQYTWRQNYLLITSQDCPFEESNDFVLLGPAFNMLARKGLLVPYSSFLLCNHWPVSEDSIRLHYSKRLFFTLTIKNSSCLFWNHFSLVLKRFSDFEQDPESRASLNEHLKNLEAVGEKLRR